MRREVGSTPSASLRNLGAAMVAVAAVIGTVVGTGWSAALLGASLLAALLVLMAKRELFVSLAISTAIVLPVDWLTGSLIGVRFLSIPRLFAAVAVFHIVWTLWRDQGSRSIRPPTPLDYCVLAFVGIGLLSAVSAGTLDARVIWVDVTLAPCVIYFAARALGHEPRALQLLSGAVMLAAGALAASVLFDAVTGVVHWVGPSADYFWDESSANIFRPGGFVGQPVRAATLLVISLAWLPVAVRLHPRKRGVIAVLGVVVAVAVLVTFTRSAWLTMLAFAVLFMFAVWGARRAVVISVALAAAAVVPVMAFLGTWSGIRGVLRPDTILYRLKLWEYSLAPIGDFSPQQLLFGLGTLASRDSDFGMSSDLVQSGTHNAYITVLVEHGPIALAAYVLIVVLPLAWGASMLRRGSESRPYGLTLMGLSIAFGLAGVSSEIVRQYSVPLAYLAGVACLTTALRASHSGEERSQPTLDHASSGEQV